MIISLYTQPLEKDMHISEIRNYTYKSNAVYSWFKYNIKDTLVSSNTFIIYLENIEYLLTICKDIRENHNLAYMLPIEKNSILESSYNQNYYNDIDTTIEALEQCKKLNFSTYLFQFMYINEDQES
jgi:hypothetical protein